MASDSEPMPAAASEAFDKAIALDAKDPRARYFLAVRKDIGGDHQGAIDDWFALLSDTPRGAPWEADLRRTIEQVGALHTLEVAGRLAAARPRARSEARRRGQESVSTCRTRWSSCHYKKITYNHHTESI